MFIQGEIIYAPALPISARRPFSERGGGVYIWKPPAAGFYTPPLFYHCHHKHYRPEKILSELFPAILDRIITGNYSKRINLIVIRVHYRNRLAVQRSHDTRTAIP